MVLFINCKTDRLGGWGAYFAFPSLSFAKKPRFGLDLNFIQKKRIFFGKKAVGWLNSLCPRIPIKMGFEAKKDGPLHASVEWGP